MDFSSKSEWQHDQKIINLVETLAVSYKQDWKKIARRIHKLTGVMITPDNLRLFNKELKKGKKTRTVFTKKIDEIII